MKCRLILLALTIVNVSIAQYTGDYYDQISQTDTGTVLKVALHDLIYDHTEYSYSNLRDFILRESDEDPTNSSNVILLYKGTSQAKSTFGGGANDWNREHVWAKSHGDFGNTAPAGTDAHHIRPTDASVNSARGNLDFDNGGSTHSEATECKLDDDSFEPRDEVKGDVARMMFYMAVRYEGGGGEPDLELVDRVNTTGSTFGKLSTLLQWHEQDPVSDFERTRNEVVFSYQKNRNPFIDHPEYVARIWKPETVVSIDSVATLPLILYKNGIVTVDQSQIGKQLQVVSNDGKLVYRDTLSSESFELPLATGVYIFKVEEQTTKVIVP